MYFEMCDGQLRSIKSPFVTFGRLVRDALSGLSEGN